MIWPLFANTSRINKCNSVWCKAYGRILPFVMVQLINYTPLHSENELDKVLTILVLCDISGLIIRMPPLTRQLIRWAVTHALCKMMTAKILYTPCPTLPHPIRPGKKWLQMQKVRTLLSLAPLHNPVLPLIPYLQQISRLVCSLTVLKLC